LLVFFFCFFLVIFFRDASILAALVLIFSYNAIRLPIELSHILDDVRGRRKVQGRIIFCWLAVLFMFCTYGLEYLSLEQVQNNHIWLLIAQTFALQLTSWAIVNNFSSPWEKARRRSLSKASRRSSVCTLDQSNVNTEIVTLPRGSQMRVRINVRSPKTPHASESKSHTNTHTRRSSRSQVLMFPRSPPGRIAEFADIKRHRRISSRGVSSVTVSMYDAATSERPVDFESIKEEVKKSIHLQLPDLRS